MLSLLCSPGCSLQPCNNLLGRGWPLGSPVCCAFFCLVTLSCVSWSPSELRARLVPLNLFKPSSYFVTDRPKAVLLLWNPMCYLCFMFVFAIMSCLFLKALWSLAGKDLTSWLYCVGCFLCFCHFPMWCPGCYLIVSIPDRFLFPYFVVLTLNPKQVIWTSGKTQIKCQYSMTFYHHLFR